jgi:hypothetical protein
MTMQDGRVVTLSFRDWLGLIGLVASILIVLFSMFTSMARAMERIDTTLGYHAHRLDKVEARLDRETK